MANMDLTIVSLRGGMNDTEPAVSLPDDEVVAAMNVEFFFTECGERRKGMTPLNLTGTSFANQTSATFCGHIDQWYPTNDPTKPEWFVGSGTVPNNFGYQKSNDFGTTWTTVGADDQETGTTPSVYQNASQSLNGVIPLFFFAYKTLTANIDRMHVYDTDTGLIRRSGFATPNAPTAVDHGAGAFSGTRYYRVRYVQKAVTGGAIVRRSEPSAALTFTPSGAGDGATVTKPAALGERETHWELEASSDNVTFYLIATTVIATTTFLDQTALATGYSSNPQSDVIGTYLPLPAAKFLAADSDRLLLAGHFYDTTRQSTIYWTPVYNDPFPGQFERLPLQQNNTINLDNGDGGPITGITSAINGSWYAFKWNKIYQIIRTYNSSIAYSVVTLATEVGALPGSIFEGVDENGIACIYFLDPTQGPARVGPSGIQFIRGQRTTWQRVNLHAQLPAFGCYYPYKRQAHWWIAVDGANTPNFKIINQTDQLRVTADGGLHRGWVQANGLISKAFCVGLLTGVPVSGSLLDSLNPRPCAGFAAPYMLQSCDVTDYDSGTFYTGSITTKPYMPVGVMNRYGMRAATGLVNPSSVQSITVQLNRDFGLETNTFTLSQVPAASETLVTSDLDNLAMSSARAIQVTFTDAISSP